MDHASWGQSHDDAAVRAATADSGLRFVSFDDECALVDRTVGLLTAGKVVGWMQGGFEWGPRALGHRSILADPTRAAMKDIVNVKIKFREPYRPFAPSALVERTAELFDLDEPTRHLPARFMLLVTSVREAARDRIPAVTHVDGSVRVQTVPRETNPLYHSLIDRFGQATGIPVLLNTSFNLRGEPIVNTPAEAISTFQRSGMDALVIGSTLLCKEPS